MDELRAAEAEHGSVVGHDAVAAPRVLMGLPYRERATALYRRLPMLAVTHADEAEFASSGAVRFAQRAMSQQAA